MFCLFFSIFSYFSPCFSPIFGISGFFSSVAGRRSLDPRHDSGGELSVKWFGLNRENLNRYTKRPLQDCALILSHSRDGGNCVSLCKPQGFLKCQESPLEKIHRFFRWIKPFAAVRSGSGVSDSGPKVRELQAESQRYGPQVRATAGQTARIRTESPTKGPRMGFRRFYRKPPLKPSWIH